MASENADPYDNIHGGVTQNRSTKPLTFFRTLPFAAKQANHQQA